MILTTRSEVKQMIPQNNPLSLSLVQDVIDYLGQKGFTEP